MCVAFPFLQAPTELEPIWTLTTAGPHPDGSEFRVVSIPLAQLQTALPLHYSIQELKAIAHLICMALRSHIEYQLALPHADGFELGGAMYLASSPGHRGCVAWGRGYVPCATPSPLVPDSCVQGAWEGEGEGRRSGWRLCRDPPWSILPASQMSCPCAASACAWCGVLRQSNGEPLNLYHRQS